MPPAATPRTRLRSARAPRRTGLVAGLLLALGTLVTLLAPPATAQAEICTPTPSTACLNGTIRTAAGEPAVGVAISITGPEEVSAVTGADGRWSVEVTTAGEYAVAVDEATLPAGETLRDPASNPRTVTVTLGSSGGALFPLGEPAAPSAPPGDGTDGESEGPAEPAPGGSGEPGLDTPTQGGTSGRPTSWTNT